MAAVTHYDRIKDTTVTNGTGTYSLDGTAVSGFRPFTGNVANGARVAYCVVDEAGEWEVNIGTFTTTGATLTRDILLGSSTGSAINWTGGATKSVFVTVPALFSPVLKHNGAGAAAPTTNENATDGYETGSLWLDTTGSGALYVCRASTTSAATWARVPMLSATDTQLALFAAPRTTTLAPGYARNYDAIDEGATFVDNYSTDFVWSALTADATPRKMSWEDDYASNYAFYIEASCVGVLDAIVAVTDPATGDSASWRVTATAKTNSDYSTTALVGTPTVTALHADAGAATWSVAANVDSPNNTLYIEVTGEAAHNLVWSAGGKMVQAGRY